MYVFQSLSFSSVDARSRVFFLLSLQPFRTLYKITLCPPKRGMDDIGFHFAVVIPFFSIVRLCLTKSGEEKREWTNQRIKWILHGQRRWEVLEGFYDSHTFEMKRTSIQSERGRKSERERGSLFPPKSRLIRIRPERYQFVLIAWLFSSLFFICVKSFVRIWIFLALSRSIAG